MSSKLDTHAPFGVMRSRSCVVNSVGSAALINLQGLDQAGCVESRAGPDGWMVVSSFNGLFIYFLSGLKEKSMGW